MDRRLFLAGSTAALGLAATSAPARTVQRVAARPGSGDARLNALFEQIFKERVARSPELATSLGLDKGPLAGLKAKFETRSAAAVRAEEVAIVRRDQARVQAIPLASLSDAARLNREVVLYQFAQSLTAPTRFGIDSTVRPYPIFQQGGAYFSTPDFLNTDHTVETRSDAEAYLSRLAQFPTLLDNDTAEQRAQAARGFLAPGWSLDLTLGQLKKLRDQPAATSSMVESLVSRTAAKNLAGDWQRRATAIVERQVYPALDRQIAVLEKLRPTTRPGDGGWRLPDGEAIYAAALAQMTTTRYSADEVHRLGLAQVAEITAELDGILRNAGYTQGSVGERLAALNKDAAQLYPNNDEGRAALIASLNEGVRAMTAKLPRAFATLPTQPLEIRRVPPEIQDGASNGYYNRASLDGSRPAIYFINLKDTGDWPKYSLPALTYHEGVPGHHLQISLAQESADIPTLRKIGFFSAYSEGWALYAEGVADELGGYSGIERAGFLQSYLFRAARLVVDTGIHTKRWSREKATDYLVATTGFARARSQREVERYCTQLGQACTYKIGHMAWTRARAEAEKGLGAKFDEKAFHEVLKDGAMPLTILERRVRERTAAALA
ncbi:DUF885 domain-containing protein [Sphingomonas astaxanthinifaciens]|uniref:Tat pathway signal protein n=1 Tax=Sphingomonas astaxanthinifaciens DSM 22298 TaxID=1123267 RepID=A0ABQ5Z8X7_9SPHN|nr:DUF885 family protein [Sphingomonas astaxanthinifaciens]GLR48080.1 Tat pathway signal protein [Sphingomonas astaxanthinifaciens DSM 22298]